MSIGIPKQAEVAALNRALIRNLLLLAIVGLLALVAAWTGGMCWSGARSEPS